MTGNQVKLSFIVPCYNERDNVEPFYEAFSTAFSHYAGQWELVFIDDGSNDGTYETIASLSRSRPGIVAIRFSRNFGKEAAIYAGLKNVKGEIIGIIDADLQQDPRDALAMVSILERDLQYDSVAAYQENRSGNSLVNMMKNGFYKVLRKLSSMDVVGNASDFRVFRKQVANAILDLPESFRFSKGIFSWIGFETYPYPYTPSERNSGESKWSFVGLLKYAIEGILAFTTSPLRIATVIGLITSIVSLLYFIVIITQTIVFGIDVPGYATTIGVVLLLGGIELFVMGIMGEYIARTYVQGKHRPIYIEKSRIESSDENLH